MKTGILDKNGVEIQSGHTIKYETAPGRADEDYGAGDGLFVVRFGKGTYDSGIYTYIGFYCEPLDKEESADGFGWALTVDSKFLEVMA